MGLCVTHPSSVVAKAIRYVLVLICCCAGSLAGGQNPAIWDGGTGTWFSNPTNWFCIVQGFSVPCGPPDNSAWDVNIGNSGIDGTVLLNMPVTVRSLTLGVGGNGTLDVSGSNTLTTNTTTVGNSPGGAGVLNVGGGGSVSDTTGDIGALSGSVGSVSVAGTGARWNNSGTLYVGDNGRGTLSITSGGVVTSGGAEIGFQAGSSGTVTVSGNGSQWTNTGGTYSDYIGSSASGTLIINAGGVVNDTSVPIGLLPGSSGTVTVTGPGSQWNLTGPYGAIVGFEGQGTLNILNGGVVNDRGGSDLGAFSGAVGIVTVSGVGSVWNNQGADVGCGGCVQISPDNGGQGTVNVQNGGIANSTTGVQIGYVQGSGGGSSSGTVTVSGAGSQWNISGHLYVGDGGQGTLTVGGGGFVNAIGGTVIGSDGASTSTGSGTITVTGAGSELSTSVLSFGELGNGTLTLQHAGSGISTGGVDVGLLAGFAGTMTLTDSGTTWTNSGGQTIVGDAGTGTLNVENSAVFSTSSSLVLGDQSGGNGTVIVADRGSQLNAGGSLVIGGSGQGTLTIQNSGLVTSDSAIIGNQSGSVGSVTVMGSASQWNNSGNLYIGYQGGQGILTINNGGAMNNGSGSFISGVNLSNWGYIYMGHGTLSVQGTVENTIAGNLELNSSTVAFGTLVNDGEMNLSNGSLSVNGDISNSGSLGFDNSTGTVHGNLSGGGILAAFNSSQLTVGGNVSASDVDLQNGSSLTVNGNLVATNSLFNTSGSSLVVNGNLTSTTFMSSASTTSVSGTFTNQTANSFFFDAPPDVVSVGNFVNEGFAEVGGTLNVNGMLANLAGATAIFSSGAITAGTLTNDGALSVLAAALNLTNQPNGLTDVVAGSTFDLGDSGTFTAGANNGFYKLTSIEGSLILENGLTTVITPQNGTLSVSTSGYLDIDFGTFVEVNGNVSNAGFVATNDLDRASILPFANTLTIAGVFANDPGATFIVGEHNDTSDVASVGGLVNNGRVIVGAGATLNLTNQPAGMTDVAAGSSFDLAGTFKAGANNGFYQLTSVEGTLVLENGQTTTATPIGGTFTVGHTGFVEITSGTTFNINGNLQVNFGGIFSVDDPGQTTVNINGMVVNLGGQINVVGPLATLNMGSLGNGGMLMLPEGSTVNLAHGFYQLATGTLGEAIGAAGFALIVVADGSVALDGTLDIVLNQGFDPAVGTTYKFFLFAPGELSGTFATIQNDYFNNDTEKWLVTYDNADGYVELTAEQAGSTPEPGTLLLLGSGLLGAVYAGRKRWLR